VIKHILQGNLEHHNAFVIVAAEHGVVNLHRAVTELQRRGAHFTVPGFVAHRVGFAAVGALRPVHVLGPQAALRIEPQHVQAVARQQKAARVRLHPGVLVTAIQRFGMPGWLRTASTQHKHLKMKFSRGVSVHRAENFVDKNFLHHFCISSVSLCLFGPQSSLQFPSARVREVLLL